MIEDQPTMDGESAIPLDGLAAGADFLEAIVVFMLTHVYTYASWVRPSAHISAAAISTSLREAFAAATTASSRLAESSSSSRDATPATLTIEDGSRIVIVQRIRSFGVATVFERDTPLGLARAHAHKIVRTLEHELPRDVKQPPSSRPLVTLVMPTYVEPRAAAQPEAAPPKEERAAPATGPIARADHASAGRRTDEAGVSPVAASTNAAGSLHAKPGPTVVSAEDDAPPPTSPSLGPNAVAGDRLGLRRPPAEGVTAPPSSATPAALSLVHAERPREPGSESPPETRAIRILAYVEGTSIEPHISLLRLALRSGLGLGPLREPRRLSAEQVLLLETAAEEMLGLERGKLSERIRSSVPVLPLPARGST